MRRWLWGIPAALLVAAALADTAVWYFTVQQMRDGLADWVAARRASGWTISAVAPAAGGWPVAATLTLRDVELSGGKADIPGGLSWRADRVELRLAPRDPHVLRIETAGLQHLRLSDAPAFEYSATRLELLVPLQADPEAQPLDLQGKALRAHVTVAGGEDSMTIATLDAHAVLHPDAGRGQQAVSLAAAAGEIALPPRVDWPLGQNVRSLAVEAALDGPLSGAPTLTQRAAEWRAGGGAIHVQHLALRWGALDLTAQAALGLDDQLQPAASGTALVAGYAPTLDVLATHGVISNSAAVASKAMLSLIAVTPADGGPAEVEVPLSLQQGTLSMHQIPLVRLPKLDWPPS